MLHVSVQAAACDGDPETGEVPEHAACHLYQQDWGIPVVLVEGAADRLDPRPARRLSQPLALSPPRGIRCGQGRRSRGREAGWDMAMVEILGPILIGVALLVVLAVVVDRRRRTPGSRDTHDRLTDSPRPPEAHRFPGQSDQYNR